MLLLIVKTVITKEVLIDKMAIDHMDFLTNTRWVSDVFLIADIYHKMESS